MKEHRERFGESRSYKSRGRRIILALTASTGAMLLALLTIALATGPSRAIPSRPSALASPPPSHETSETLESARTVEKFYAENREAVLAGIVEKAKVDRRYGETIGRIDEAYVMSLPNFSEAKKREMWNRIKDAQNAVKQAGLDR